MTGTLFSILLYQGAIGMNIDNTLNNDMSYIYSPR